MPRDTPVLVVLDLGPDPAASIEAIRTITDLGARRAAELVELLPAYVGLGLGDIEQDLLRQELERAGATVDRRVPPRSPVVPSASPTGDASVVLVHPGDDRLRVTKLLHAATGFTLREAKRLVDGAPTVVASGLTADAAVALRRELVAAGARVEDA